MEDLTNLDPCPWNETSVAHVIASLLSLTLSALGVPQLVELPEQGVEDGGVGWDGHNEGDDVDGREDAEEVDLPDLFTVNLFLGVKSEVMQKGNRALVWTRKNNYRNC